MKKLALLPVVFVGLAACAPTQSAEGADRFNAVRSARVTATKSGTLTNLQVSPRVQKPLIAYMRGPDIGEIHTNVRGTDVIASITVLDDADVNDITWGSVYRKFEQTVPAGKRGFVYAPGQLNCEYVVQGEGPGGVGYCEDDAGIPYELRF